MAGCGAAAGFLLCVIVGLVTGLLVAVIGVHPILVTLGTRRCSRLQHLFHPRADAFGISRCADPCLQRNDPRHPDLVCIFAVVAWRCTCS